jgi:ATP-dependent Zn protease
MKKAPSFPHFLLLVKKFPLYSLSKTKRKKKTTTKRQTRREGRGGTVCYREEKRARKNCVSALSLSLKEKKSEGKRGESETNQFLFLFFSLFFLPFFVFFFQLFFFRNFFRSSSRFKKQKISLHFLTLCFV